MAAWSVALSLFATPLAAQACLGGTEESAGWLAVAYGRAAEGASLVGGDFAWQLSRTFAVLGDGDVTAYPKPDPQRNRVALGAAYTVASWRRFGLCVTPAFEGERIGDLRVERIPVGVSLGWSTAVNDGQRRLGFRLEPFFVHSHERIAGFSHTSNFVSGRVGVVFGVQRLLLGLEHEHAFDGDARWHTRARVGLVFP